MRILLIRLALVLIVLSGVSGAAYKPFTEFWKKRNTPEFRTAEVSRGDVVSIVNATGKIKPVESILIGAVVSGPIVEMPEAIEFNAPIKKGDLMARIDPQLFQARVDADTAAVTIRRADVERASAEIDRAQAQLAQAERDEARAKALRETKNDFVSQAEMDRVRYFREQLAATVLVAKAAFVVAEASVTQAEANLKNSETNLVYTRILAPKDGIIIDRKIEPGQSLASQFQTPELFEIGVGMRERMHIYASVDENDIGLINKAQKTNQKVQFTVSSQPDELFTGRILQIRMSATETQAVVTYPVIVEAPNPDLILLPGMTANISFQIEEKKDILRVPNAALRYYPKREHVRQEDHEILDGSAWVNEDEDEDDNAVAEVSAEVRAESQRSRYKRHVWVQDGDKLRAVEIEIGLLDQKYGKETELRVGDLKEGQALVTGIKKKKGGFFGG